MPWICACLLLMLTAIAMPGELVAKVGGTLWADEFNGPAGAPPDPKKWTTESGGHGWGNNELEFYTTRRENSRLDGQGHLIIEARREEMEGCDYTSARLITMGKFTHVFGRYEARIKLPRGQGLWPAFWLMGNNVTKHGWPRCGEVDIMEYVGHEPGRVYGYLHGPGYSQGATKMEDEDEGIGRDYRLPDGASFADDFHVFAVEWTPAEIRWFVDETCYQTLSRKDLHGARWVFDHPFFILINLAVGGRWPGNPDETTVFPQQLLVDWIRVRHIFPDPEPPSATPFE